MNKPPEPISVVNVESLHGELRGLIEASRQRLSTAVNAELTRLYWTVGYRLHAEVLGGERASYGGKVIAQLGERLAQEFGRGFEAKNLRRMMQFAELFPDQEIVATLSRQLNWSHVVTILPLKNAESRTFYARMQRSLARVVRMSNSGDGVSRINLAALSLIASCGYLAELGYE